MAKASTVEKYMAPALEVPPVASGDPWLDREAERLAKIPSAIQRLREPFPEAETKKGQIQANGFQGTIVEWNYACDRLDEVDPAWEHYTEAKYHGPIGNKMVVEITVTLTVLGIRRMGHSAEAATADEMANAAKRVETDALKRAAAKFGVARYLYRGDSRQETAHKLTDEQLGAVHTAASNAGVQVGGSVSEWASGILGRVVDVVTEPITAAELDILIAAGGKQ